MMVNQEGSVMEFFTAVASGTGLNRLIIPATVFTRNFKFGQENVNFSMVCEDFGKSRTASSMVVDAFSKWITRYFSFKSSKIINRSDMEEEWQDILTDQNRKIRRINALNEGRMSTSVTAMLMTSENYLLMNIGASGAYRIGQDITPLFAAEASEGETSTRTVGEEDDIAALFFTGDVVPNHLYVLCADSYRYKLHQADSIALLHPEKLSSQLELQQQVDYLTLKQKSVQEQEYDSISMTAVLPRPEVKLQW
jgi:hypothetical protein